MEFITDISVLVENGGEKSQHHFEKEHVGITRATKLWIVNVSGKESDLSENLKL
ncbi:hypothetical protein J8TS2_42170 [Lederbergia ruris]|uniref:Uncharacterized protein n=1 Tax=Lederbergia ruris TaxID=217495 RepID=A0ABQ4KPN8_9BACI|nr:hypothetical protein [Lederbergia ruris]GIN59898.1 hypothetical protein J8TS2_42170 [Lederbergia ruris]